MLLISLLPITCSPCFLIEARTTTVGWAFKKCLTAESHGGIFSTEVPSPLTLACVKLTQYHTLNYAHAASSCQHKIGSMMCEDLAVEGREMGLTLLVGMAWLELVWSCWKFVLGMDFEFSNAQTRRSSVALSSFCLLTYIYQFPHQHHVCLPCHDVNGLNF